MKTLAELEQEVKKPRNNVLNEGKIPHKLKQGKYSNFLINS